MVDWCKSLGAEVILNHRNNLYEELKTTGVKAVDAIFCTTYMEAHWTAMADCIRPKSRIVLIDAPASHAFYYFNLLYKCPLFFRIDYYMPLGSV